MGPERKRRNPPTREQRIGWLIRRVNWLMKAAEWREAASLLGQLAKMRGSDRDWAGLGVAREQLGEHWSARRAYLQSLQVNSQNSTARLGLERLVAPDESVAPKGPKEYLRTTGSPGYVSRCWNCREVIDSAEAIRCDQCRLFICDGCGECRCRAPLGEGFIEAPDVGLEDDHWE